VDVLASTPDGLISVGESNEFYILMEEAEGRNYFMDLEEIKRRGHLTPADKRKALTLSEFLVKIHSEKHDHPSLYKRRIRDTVGHGECVMGVLDTYPEVNFTDEQEFTEIAMKCVRWWGKIKSYSHRLCVVHGDFHPGNIWWYGGEEVGSEEDFILLDRSRGVYGEPADDVSCLSINYLFYALLRDNAFKPPFSELFECFLTNYLEKTNDHELLEVIAPFYAFRAVVIANPLFYPNVSDEVRRKLFNFAQGVLDAEEFELVRINQYLEG
jgi:aminoglycoside phosphotransferase (APT) family kinase protein